MRSLVFWDDPDEAELLAQYLSVGEDEAWISTDPDEFLEWARTEGEWDVVLLSTHEPRPAAPMATFHRLRELLPECPVVGAALPGELFRIAGFLTHGLRCYVVRDEQRDYVFYLHATLSSTVEAVRAERERLISARLREEIESVRRLQDVIMPRDLHAPKGYRICGRYEPSEIQVLGGKPVVLAGGDYYDVFLPDDHNAVLLLGDASGHGMKACLSIMTMHALVRVVHEKKHAHTAAFVEDINHQICDQAVVNEDGGFITLLYAHLQARRHRFQWTSAGHPVPLLHRLADNAVLPLGRVEDCGLPLGILPQTHYQSTTADIPPNCRLLVYTDGLAEAFPGTTRHDEFGVNGITATLQACRDRPLDETLQALFAASHDHTRGTGRHDDTSVVLIERL